MYVFDMYEFQGEIFTEDLQGWGAEHLLSPGNGPGASQSGHGVTPHDDDRLATSAAIHVLFRELVSRQIVTVHHEFDHGGHALIVEWGGSNDPDTNSAHLVGPADCWEFLYPMDSPGALTSEPNHVRTGNSSVWADWSLERYDWSQEFVRWRLESVGRLTASSTESEFGGLTWEGLSPEEQLAVVMNIADHVAPTAALATLLMKLHPATASLVTTALEITDLAGQLQEYSTTSEST